MDADQLFQKSSLPYPYGWGKLQQFDQHGINQIGLTPGFSTSMALYQESGLQVICLSNIEAGAWVKWSNNLAAIACGKAHEVVAPRPPFVLSAAKAKLYSGRYVGKDHTMESMDRGRTPVDAAG